MTERLSIALSTADARTWGEAITGELRRYPEGDPRRMAMRDRIDRAMRGNHLFTVDFRNGCSVMVPTSFARALLIEVREWK